MRISIQKLYPKLLALVLCLTSCLGSFYYFLSGRIQLVMMISLAVLVLWPLLSQQYIRVNVIQFFTYIFMVFFIIRNNPKLQSTSVSLIILMTSLLTFILIAQYHRKEWIDIFMTLCKLFYLFYAVYTILEKFSVQLFLLSLKVFSSSIETLYSQYARGCMPGLTNHYSTNGMLLGVGIVIFGCELIYRKDLKNLILFLVMVIALLLTGKRSDILFTMVGVYLAYYCYMSNKKNSRLVNTIGIIIIVGIALLVIVNFVPSLATFVTRFEDTAESGDVTLGRTKMWAIAIDYFKQNPIIGLGWGRFSAVNLHEWNAHNIYLQILAETGIVGFLVFIFFFVSTLVNSWKHLKWIRINGKTSYDNEELHMLFAIAMQVFFLLYGITGNPLYDKEAYVPYYISCAISTFYVNSSKRLREDGIMENSNEKLSGL